MATEPAPSTPDPALAPLRLAFSAEHLLPVVGEIHRYRILTVLMDGADHSAAELARLVNQGRAATSKHLACLRTAGLIELNDRARDRRTTYYRLAPALRPADGAPRQLDFGWCVLRF